MDTVEEFFSTPREDYEEEDIKADPEEVVPLKVGLREKKLK